MIKRICYFAQTPLTHRDYERFAFERLQARGFEVTFLDMTRLINPNYLQNYQPESIDYKNIVVAETNDDILNFFRDNRSVFGIDLIVNKNLFFYRAMRKYKIKYASLCVNDVPTPLLSISKPSVIKSLKRLNLKYIYNKFLFFLNSLPDSTVGIQPPMFILAGSKRYAERLPSHWKNLKVIWAHALDYDLYLNFNLRKPEPFVKYDYLLFLDEYLPFHPDFSLSSAFENPYREPEEYYNELNSFFDYFENRLRMPIVIAAHPRSQYEHKPDFFGGRKQIKGKTVDLVANAKGILAHGSTAINFAVLFEKPIIFLMPPKVKSNYFGQFITNFAKQFNKTPKHIDAVSDIDIDKEFVVDREVYWAYKESYIKMNNSPPNFFGDIVAGIVQNEFK